MNFRACFAALCILLSCYSAARTLEVPELHELLEAHEAPEVLEALEVQRHTSVLNGNCVVELNLTNKRHPCPPTPHPPFENE